MPEWLSKVLPNLAVEPAEVRHHTGEQPTVATESE
jgi:hypothetical protein